MPVETFSYLDSLVATNPVTSEGIVNGDDHIRGIKSTLLATFPNITGAVQATQSQLDTVVSIASRNSTVPAGMMMDFGGTSAPTGWLACDGQQASRTTYADLFAAIGTTWGSGDGSTTFNVPNLINYFRRHRETSGLTLAGAVGTKKSPTNLAHTHTGSGSTSGSSAGTMDHTHSININSNTESNLHTHLFSVPGTLSGGGALVGSSAPSFQVPTTYNGDTGVQSALHTHNVAGNSGGMDRSLDHTHTYSFTTASSGDASEARPYSATVLTCIKT